MGQDARNERGSKESTVRRYLKQAKKLAAREKAAEFERIDGPRESEPFGGRSGKRARKSRPSDPRGHGKDGSEPGSEPQGAPSSTSEGDSWAGDYEDAPEFERIRKSAKKGRRRATPGRTRMSGTVTAVDRGLVSVLVKDLGLIRARPLQLALPDPDQTPVVGDVVDLSERRDVFRVEAVHPRRTVLRRADPSGRGVARVIAANVELGVIVVPATDPHPGLVERMRIALDRGGVLAQVVVNKVDLVDDVRREEVRLGLAFLEEEGQPAIETSVMTREGIDRLRAAMAGRTCVFIGHSGVGKSTLLNALDPAHQRSTADVREGDGKGRHTTTRSELTELDDGTRVIDTPGVRAFGLHEVSEADVQEHFAELGVLPCRFRDCRHLGDDGCAADQAAANGEVDVDRLTRFRRVVRSLEEAP